MIDYRPTIEWLLNNFTPMNIEIEIPDKIIVIKEDNKLSIEQQLKIKQLVKADFKKHYRELFR